MVSDDTGEIGEGLGDNDLAWAVPTATKFPLGLAFGAVLGVCFGLDWVLVSLVPFAFVVAVLFVIDLRELILPTAIIRKWLIASPVLLGLSLLSPRPELSLLRAVAGGVVLFLVYHLIWLIAHHFAGGGFGYGDVRLSGMLGLQAGLFSWSVVAQTVLFAHLIGGVVSILLVVGRRAGRKTAVPFGPFLISGSILALGLYGLATT